jgi:hypothetical protein
MTETLLTPPSNQISENWAGSTDPSHHNPDEFRYMVHAINPSSMVKYFEQSAIPAGVEASEFDGDPSIDLAKRPELLAGRLGVSMTVVDEAHRGTYGRAGVIVKVPSENVIMASPSDIGSAVNDRHLLSRQAARAGEPPSADNVLAGTVPAMGSYNEVVAVGTRHGSELQPEGFFYKTKFGIPTSPRLALQARRQARRLGLPVVAIKEHGRRESHRAFVAANAGRRSLQHAGVAEPADPFL